MRTAARAISPCHVRAGSRSRTRRAARSPRSRRGSRTTRRPRRGRPPRRRGRAPTGGARPRRRPTPPPPPAAARGRGIESGESGAGEGRQEEEDEGDGGESRPAVQERPAPVARHGDAQEEEQQRPRPMASIALRRNRWPSFTSPITASCPSPRRLHQDAAAQARGDSGGERRVVGQRAADEDAQVGDREGQALRALGEEGGVGALGGAAETRPEGLGAHDVPRGSHEQGPVGHEVAPLGDRLVGDALRHVAGHPGIPEAQGRARGEGPRVEDHEFAVEVDRPRGEEDRPRDAQGGGRPLPEPSPACLGHGRSLFFRAAGC